MTSSDMRVFVHWVKPTVFAGEDIECHITFKNVAAPPGSTNRSSNGRLPGSTTANDRSRKTSQLVPKLPPPNRGHRPTLSLNQPSTYDRGYDSWAQSQNERSASGRGPHRRSVSIISLGQNEGVLEEFDGRDSTVQASPRSSKGHLRAASLQILPRRGMSGLGPFSAPLTNRSATLPSPRFPNSSPRSGHERTKSGTPSRKGSGQEQQGVEHQNDSLAPSGDVFQFPAVRIDQPSSIRDERSAGEIAGKLLSPRARTRESMLASTQQITPATRIISPLTYGETPRSSGEFYSLSNNSTETMASECQPPQQGRLLSQGLHTRRASNLGPGISHRATEVLMMGYAQVSGSFTVDGSLVSQAPFEEVKRKGVLGGQGGGVVGVAPNKRDSGMLKGFGWSNIGESFSGLLKGSELSSLKEMRGTASSKSIPLLSTPQSILFVDLKLAPGESKTFKYSFRLPKGLPPSHRGKAIKISYQLVIGTQRAGGAKEHQVRSIEAPFRLLGSVNSYGEMLGHDLMSPYILLRDEARVQLLDTSSKVSAEKQSLIKQDKSARKTQSCLDEFLEYADELLETPRQNSSLGLLSPTAEPLSRRLSGIEEPTTAKEAIDLAILRSNLATDQQQSANRFEIARNGQRVAVIMLARPAYRLGETVTAVIEFTEAQIPCYALHASLETTEKVDPSIALRSEASIHRVTRRVYSSQSESTLFARRVIFTPTIPLQATPNFVTSNISLEWKMIIEFVTPRLPALAVNDNVPSAALLEEISKDDRGIILAAVERLDCESFEIAVPLRIYGAAGGSTEKAAMSEGQVV